ncbi:hypothetical protein NEAUS03_0207 [Nematocida ausubeli]|nr:hypothetical protein NEAUS03_0207 [Nematocida ausubeli]
MENANIPLNKSTPNDTSIDVTPLNNSTPNDTSIDVTPLNKNTPNDTSIDVTPLDKNTPASTSIDVTESNTNESWKRGKENYVKWHKRIHLAVSVVHALLIVGYFLLFGAMITKGFPLDRSDVHSKIQTLVLLGLVFLSMYSLFIPMLRKLFNFYNPNFNNRNISGFTKRKIISWFFILFIALGSGLSFGEQHRYDISIYKRYFSFSYVLVYMSFMVIALDMIGALYSLVHIARLRDPYEKYKDYINYARYISVIVIVMGFFLGCGSYGFNKKLTTFSSEISSQLDSITKN